MTIAIVLLLYGAITAAGGAMIFTEAKNNLLLIVGILSGVALIVAGVLLLSGFGWASYLGFAINVLLIGILGKRYAKAREAMPTKMMLGISVVVAGVLFTEIFQ